LEIAREITDKTNFRYKKPERGLSALSELGEFATSLIQFPKGVINLYYESARNLFSGDSLAKRWDGAQGLLGLAISAALTNELLKMVTGQKTYFDPLIRKEVEYKPYGLLESMTGIQFGGAQVGQAITVTEMLRLLVEIGLEQSKTEGKSEARLDNLNRSFLKRADTLVENFVPFVRKGLDVMESLLGAKYYKLLTTTFDHITDRRTALSKNRIQRGIIEMMSHAIFGTERGPAK